MSEAEGTDNLQVVMLHLHHRAHRLRLSLEGDVHQISDDEVIVMVAQGNLVETVVLREAEEGLAAVPCAEEASRLPRVCTLIEGGVDDMQWHVEIIAELLQIGAVCLVRYVVHDDMRRRHFYVRTEYPCSLCHQTSQHQRVLAA